MQDLKGLNSEESTYSSFPNLIWFPYTYDRYGLEASKCLGTNIGVKGSARLPNILGQGSKLNNISEIKSLELK